MATANDILVVREYINEPDTSGPYTDERLAALIDAQGGDLRATARVFWEGKAASYSGLVDVKEGSSDRKLSQLYTNALAIAKTFAPAVTPVDPTTVRRPGRTRPIERP